MDTIFYVEALLDLEAEANYLHQKSVSETAPLHGHEFYEIFLVIQGRAIHIINNCIQNLERGSLVFIRPGDVHCYDFYKTYDFEFVNIGFPVKPFLAVETYFDNSEAFETIKSSIMSPLITLNEYDTHYLENKIKLLSPLIQNGDKKKVKLYFRALLVEIIYKYFISDYTNLQEHRPNLPSWLAELLQAIRNFDNFSVGLDRMIELSNCSQEHLTRECKKYLNLTPTQIINENRLNYAAYLLKTTDIDVLTICQDSGFNNLSHFYHLFKKMFRCSPTGFRKK